MTADAGLFTTREWVLLVWAGWVVPAVLLAGLYWFRLIL